MARALPEAGRGEPIARVTRFVEIDADRTVCEIAAGPYRFGSIHIDRSTGRPRVCWPRTAKGYGIIDVAEPFRSRLEAAILDQLAQRGRPSCKTQQVAVVRPDGAA